MSEEERKLAKRENSSLFRLMTSFLMSCAYGVIAFLAVWKLKDAVPSLLVSALPDVSQSDPVQLYTYVTIFVAGIIWFVTFMVLWLTIDRLPDMKKRLVRLGIWCAGAAAVYLIGVALLNIALKLR